VRSRSLILVATVLLVLVGAAAGGVYAYDHARADQIAQGVQVGGVALGGLTRAQARIKLERVILGPLKEPIVVHHARKTWKLGSREAQISADLGAMVDEAVARSRDGNLLARSFREISGGRVNADLRPTVRFSDAAIVRLIDKVRKSVERPAKDAKVTISAAGISKVPGHDGISVRASDLHRSIKAAIVSPTASRSFVADTRHVSPKVSNDDLATKYATVLIVNRKAFRLTLYKNLKVKKSYGIAVGQVGLETPAGLYTIQNKAIDPAWHVPNSDWAGKLAGTVIPGGAPNNPIKARWLGVYDGVGVHGTSDDASIGSNASHGCIRMHIPDVEELYPEVPVGSPIYIA
jgi:lipoprotein-anchoring transpeptidase ErfK/SrfK